MLEDIKFSPGQRVRSSFLQRMVEAVRMLLNISAAPPLRVTVNSNGVFLSMSDITGGTETMYQVTELVPLTQSSGYVVYKCYTVDSDGNLGSTLVPVWTRPDVAFSDNILCFQPTNGTGVSYDPGSGAVAVDWMQQGADSPGVFPALLQKTGGINSTSASSASTWTYTVRLVTYAGTGTSSAYELGTVVAQTKPREVGQRGFQAGSTSGYGLCFYIGNTLKLWDAGERITGGGC